MLGKCLSLRFLFPACVLFSAWQAPVLTAAETQNEVREILGRQLGVYTTPPTTVGALDPAVKVYRVPDGPLMGNGDLAVAVGGTETEQTFYLSKSDLSQSNRGLGGLTYHFGAQAGDGNRYRQEQDLYRSEITSRLPFSTGELTIDSWTADDGNVLVNELTLTGGDPLAISLDLWSHFQAQAGCDDGAIWATREFVGTVGTTKAPFSSLVGMSTRIIGATSTCTTDGKKSSSAAFSLLPGKKVRIVTCVAGGYQAVDHVAKAKAAAAAITEPGLERSYAHHLAWWEAYWAKSHIVLNDPMLEKYYYGALYILACGSREGSVAPGLAGPWHLNGPICWSNKYTLDYNFQAVWWGVYAANRTELALPYYDVISKLIPAGKQLAQENGTKGVLFAVNAHAWGGFTDLRTLNMKGNASLAALNFMMHYHYTCDDEFLLSSVWPLLHELADFWEDNLTWDKESSSWVILNSSTRENQHNTNPINELSYVQTIFRFLLETSPILEGKIANGTPIHFTAEQKTKWQGYIDHISPFPTIVFNDKTVFKEAGDMKKMSLGGPGDNSDVLFHVFPGESLSLGSDPKLLQIASDTVAAMNSNPIKQSWYQANCFPKIYTQAVRSGFSGETVADALRTILLGKQPYNDRGDHAYLRNNATIMPPVHAYESVGGIEAINSMLMQSHDGVIRLFPVWIKGKDAAFSTLRAHGAFLVSTAIANDRIAPVELVSLAGRPCTMVNPWRDEPVELTTTISGTATTSPIVPTGDRLTFATVKGGNYRLRPIAKNP